MKSRSRWVAGFSFLLFVLVQGRAQSYDSELKLGVESYKNSRYEAAAEHFKRATELDPSKITAHIYLATTYVSQFIPGVDTPDNVALGENAIEQYQSILESDPTHEQKVIAAKGIANLYLNMKKFSDSKKYYQMASDLDPNDPEPYYSIGVIDWTECYQPRMEARAELGMRPDQSLNRKVPAQKKVCDELRIRNWMTIEDGIDSLNRAIELHPDYDDAMAYVNLMYRERRSGVRGPRGARRGPEEGRRVGRQDAACEEAQRTEGGAQNPYGTQSPIKILVSCGTLALRFEAHTSFFPSGENIGKPSKPSL